MTSSPRRALLPLLAAATLPAAACARPAEPPARAPAAAADAGPAPDAGSAAVAPVGAAPAACTPFCGHLLGCVPEVMRNLDVVKRTFPADCARSCAALPAEAVACAPARTCTELANGDCGAQVGELVRKLGGP